jgi:hypothetical protein
VSVSVSVSVGCDNVQQGCEAEVQAASKARMQPQLCAERING